VLVLPHHSTKTEPRRYKKVWVSNRCRTPTRRL
jgi:hypothetical protein